MNSYRSAAEAWHLVRRFGGALWPGGPGAADSSWVAQGLSPAELELWTRMSGTDRRHSVAVARRVAAAGAPPGVEARALFAAALLHDVGKVEAGLGTFARVGVTLAGMAFGPARVAAGAGRAGLAGKAGRYLAHGGLGAALLRATDSHELVVTWAAEHHLPSARWTVPAEVGAILKAADND